MRSDSVAIAGVGCEDPAQVGLAEDDDVIEAFPADRTKQSLRMPVLPGGLWTRRVITDAHGCKTLRDRLSLPRATSGNIDDEVHLGSAEQRPGRGAGSADGSANLCPGTGAFGICCNSWRRPQEFAANGPCRRPRYDRGTPCGSSRSVSPHARQGARAAVG